MLRWSVVGEQREGHDLGELIIENLHKAYRGVRALDGVTLTVPGGALCGVIGPNGAGKSTLLRLLGGLERPDSGRATLGGRPITGASPERLARLGVAWVAQQGRVFAELSVLENVMVAAHPWLRSVHVDSPLGSAVLTPALALHRWMDLRAHSALIKRAEGVLALVGGQLLTAPDASAASLSPAARRRLALARALVLEPRLLLLDEPAAGLNPSETADLAEVLRALKRTGMTIVLVEQKLPLVFALADQVALIEAGRVVKSGPPGRGA